MCRYVLHRDNEKKILENEWLVYRDFEQDH